MKGPVFALKSLARPDLKTYSYMESARMAAIQVRPCADHFFAGRVLAHGPFADDAE
jgi:hypothetical protein